MVVISRKGRFLRLVSQEAKFLLEHGVQKIGLFGSVVREEDSATSDLDVLIEFNTGQKTFQNFLALIDFFEEKMGCSVELLTPESLSPHFGPYILKEVEYVPLAS